MQGIKEWFRRGEPWVWLNAGAVAICIVMVVGLLGLIAARGLVHFWPHAIIEAQYMEPGKEPIKMIGELVDSEIVHASRLEAAGQTVPEGLEEIKRVLLKTGNKDVTGIDFRWLLDEYLTDIHYPEDVWVIERREWGNHYGYVKQIKENGKLIAEGKAAFDEFRKRVERAVDLAEKINKIEKSDMGAINYQLERIRLKERALELKNQLTPVAVADFKAERAELDEQYKVLKEQLDDLKADIHRDSVVTYDMSGHEQEISLANIVKAEQPNRLSIFGKLKAYVANFWAFLSEDPREANTEGGIFPAIFGTVLMVIIMSIIVTPFGVVAAVYLREYAKQGLLTRTIRVAVNNLAGVPSIVYGVFGLGFFVYFLGGSIDQLFFPEAAPAPVYGTPGLLWASITLAILTVPVVIVATEEGLTRIPKAVREGSLALGATKFETLVKVILPMSSPAMMTGLILAIARAAGEVAPLMLVGVVKLAPNLPLDGNAPFLHLERKFMHLGFHIYDVGFQSPNVEAARPLVYATAFLLVAVIAGLNLTAVLIRNRLREKYRALET